LKTRHLRRGAVRAAAALSVVGALSLTATPAQADVCVSFGFGDTYCDIYPPNEIDPYFGPYGPIFDPFYDPYYYDPFIFPYIDPLDPNSGGGGGTPAPPPPPPVLVVGQQVPANVQEATLNGPIAAKILRGTPEFGRLVTNTNPDIVFKNEENTDATLGNENTDPLMQPELKTRLDRLAELVNAEYPGLKLRVTEAFDLDNEHSGASLHYEGRAADITVSDVDGAKLGRLGQLAVDAGFELVLYENAAHVHVSVPKPPPPRRPVDVPDYTQPGRPPGNRPGYNIP
jgi:hypothetical protein